MSGLKLKYVPKFPSRVIGGSGIEVDKENGNYVIELDVAEFPTVSPYTPTASQLCLVYDPATGNYSLVPASSLSLGVGGGGPSSGTAWTPLDLGAALFAWWDFGDFGTLTLSGSSVTAVADKSNNANTLFGFGNPAWTSVGLNGHGAVQFVDLSYMATLSGLVVPQPVAICALIQMPTAKNPSFNQVYSCDISDTLGATPFFSAADPAVSGNALLYCGNYINIGLMSLSSYYLVSAGFNGSSSWYSINGSPRVPMSPGTAGIVDGILLNNQTTAQGFNGLMGGCIVTSSDLTVTDQQRIEGYLRNEFGL